jgi:hypothetical protein
VSFRIQCTCQCAAQLRSRNSSKTFNVLVVSRETCSTGAFTTQNDAFALNAPAVSNLVSKYEQQRDGRACRDLHRILDKG